ncbi:MAG TPA: TIGR04086 family membrane protein [Actinomycetota bacterium]|nr:TIGR04086 family membrane protein [Actinomycetota bacterium]
MATATHARPAPVRGGVSLAAVLTGVVVAFGTIFLLSALLGGILTALGVDASEVEPTENVNLSIGVAFVILQFLAFLWGGYTAGRMARGSGVLNGVLVPIVALLVAALVAGAVAALGAAADLNVPFTRSSLPAEDASYLVDRGPVMGLVALAAALLGGLAGGVMGARWHGRLEKDALATTEEEHDRGEAAKDRGTAAPAERTEATRATTGGAAAGASTSPPAPPDTTTTPHDTAPRREP